MTLGISTMAGLMALFAILIHCVALT